MGSGAEVTSLRGNSFEEQAHEASLTEEEGKKWGGKKWSGGKKNWGHHGGWGGWGGHGGGGGWDSKTCCGWNGGHTYQVDRKWGVCAHGECYSEEEVKYFETFLQAVKDESLGGLCNESSCTCCNPIGSHYEVDPGSYCPAGFRDSDEAVDDFEDLMEAVEDNLAQAN